MISVSGKEETTEELKIYEEKMFTIKGSVITIQDKTNKNGTIDRTYKIKAETIRVR